MFASMIPPQPDFHAPAPSTKRMSYESPQPLTSQVESRQSTYSNGLDSRDSRPSIEVSENNTAPLTLQLRRPSPGATYGFFLSKNDGYGLVSLVEENTIAAQAGIRPGLLIVSVNGIPITSTSKHTDVVKLITSNPQQVDLTLVTSDTVRFYEENRPPSGMQQAPFAATPINARKSRLSATQGNVRHFVVEQYDFSFLLSKEHLVRPGVIETEQEFFSGYLWQAQLDITPDRPARFVLLGDPVRSGDSGTRGRKTLDTMVVPVVRVSVVDGLKHMPLFRFNDEKEQAYRHGIQRIEYADSFSPEKLIGDEKYLSVRIELFKTN